MKKDLPIIVLKTFEKYVHLKGERFQVVDQDELLLKVVDIDTNSNFYFIVESHQMKGHLKLLVNWKPQSREDIGNFKGWINAKQLDAHFDQWVSYLKEYEEIHSFFDDPILNAYADEYLSEFIIIDEEAKSKPLKPNQILLLDEHLETIEKNIKKHITKENEEQIANITDDVTSLRKGLSINTKGWVIKKLVLVWAKITKQGAPFIRDLISQASKKALVEGINHVVEVGFEAIK